MPLLSIHLPFYPYHPVENTHNTVMGLIPIARSSGLFSVLVLFDLPILCEIVEHLLLETPKFSPGAIFISLSVIFPFSS